MNSNIYEEKYKIILEDTDSDGIMKLHAMFDAFHAVADRNLMPENLHKAALGKAGILWVLAEQGAEIIDLPRLNDEIIIKTWVGDVFYSFIPRFYQIEKDGKILVKASSVWALIDKESRDSLMPSKCNVYIEPVYTGNEIPVLETPKKLDVTSSFTATVLPENLDFNKHMNNAQYLKVIDEYNSFVGNGQIPRKLILRYSKEAFLGDKLIVEEGVHNTSRYYTVNSARGNHLKARIEY